MSVISITISESSLQKIAGIPTQITLSANIPSSIFFTIDGSTPTTDSDIYISPIELPTDEGSVVLSIFATDGVNSSAIITKSYGTTLVGNRSPRDKITGLNSSQPGSSYLFGGNFTDNTNAQYENVGGITVDDPALAQIPDGYDGFGTPSNFTNLPLDDYSFHFSETNAMGQYGAGIGNLPGQTVVIPPRNPSSGGSANTSSPFFNPKALVIFDDSRETPYDPDVAVTNRPFFSMEDPATARYGKNLTTSAFDGGNPMRGNALRQQYNPRDNTVTYYYFDGDTNRWIISKVPFVQKDPDMFNYSKIVFGRDQGVGRVFLWIPFAHKTLT